MGGDWLVQRKQVTKDRAAEQKSCHQRHPWLPVPRSAEKEGRWSQHMQGNLPSVSTDSESKLALTLEHVQLGCEQRRVIESPTAVAGETWRGAELAGGLKPVQTLGGDESRVTQAHPESKAVSCCPLLAGPPGRRLCSGSLPTPFSGGPGSPTWAVVSPLTWHCHHLPCTRPSPSPQAGEPSTFCQLRGRHGLRRASACSSALRLPS